MAAQLKARLPSYEGRRPWWAYCRKPDLRGARFRRLKGSRLEIETDQAISFPDLGLDCSQYLALTEPW